MRNPVTAARARLARASGARPPRLVLAWLIFFWVTWLIGLAMVLPEEGWSGAIIVIALGAFWTSLFFLRVRAIWWLTALVNAYSALFVFVSVTGPRHESIRGNAFEFVFHVGSLAILLTPEVRRYFFWRERARAVPPRTDEAEGMTYRIPSAVVWVWWALLGFSAFVTFVVVRHLFQDMILHEGVAAPGQGGDGRAWLYVGIAVVICALVAVVCVRATRVRLVVDAQGVKVVNLTNSSVVPWQAIEHFKVAGPAGILVVRRDGRRVASQVAGKSAVAMLLNKETRADQIVAQLNEDLWRYRGMPAPPETSSGLSLL
jgi:PH (Pleckstrin Homology) domain-containing protein